MDWHAKSAEHCLGLAGSSLDGLPQTEADDRLVHAGPNLLPRSRPVGWPVLLVRQFRSPLIYLLIAAAAVSLLLGHPLDAAFIGTVLLVNALLGAVQEGRAQASMAALERLIRLEARVRRDGLIRVIDAGDLVVGDIVELEGGMAVPADLRLVSAVNLAVNEALLTGESVPVAKDAAIVSAPDAGLGDRPGMAHAGTLAETGRAIGLVVATGSATSLGRIATSLAQAPSTPPPLMQRVARLARQIGVTVVALVSLVALLLALAGHPPGHILLLAVALAVSAIPEGLPVAMTVALAAATRRMAARHVIVRALPAVEGLGSCTLIASDKTGTLTLNRLEVVAILRPDGSIVDGQGAEGASMREIARTALACNDAAPDEAGELLGDSVDVALYAFASRLGDARVGARRAALPYEPANRFAAVVTDDPDGLHIHVKGAPETVLLMCDKIPATIVSGIEALARQGYRLIALAAAALPPGASPRCERPGGLTLLGVAALLDPLRPEARPAVARCREAGIGVRMITGDHPATARTIALELGIDCAPEQVVTGGELRELAETPALLGERIRQGRVFARIEPAQKLDIVRALAASGEVVAVTGDGVNDAPALKAADIGVAMGKGGTDVARAAADLILTDDNFASIVAGVEEGRITYGNMRRIVIFLLATGATELSMFIGAILTGLPMPLTAVQLIWANVVTEGVQHIALGLGRGERDELRQQPRPPSEPLLDRRALAIILPSAAVMTVLGLVLLASELAAGAALPQAQNAVLLMVVLFQNAFVLALRSERRALHREPLLANPWLLAGVAGALALHGIAMAFPPLRAVLGTAPASAAVWLFCLGAAAAVLATAELSKAAARSM